MIRAKETGMQRKITRAAVDAMASGQQLWDPELPGFGARRRGGSVSYVVKYRHSAKQRLLTLGRHGVLTPEEARKRARIALGKVASGDDPAAAIRTARAPAQNGLEKVVEAFLEFHVRPNLRAAREYERCLRFYVLPRWKGRAVDDIGRGDVSDLLDTIQKRNGPVMADHVLAVVRKLFNWHAARKDRFRSPIVSKRC
jgi:hypothetical protein